MTKRGGGGGNKIWSRKYGGVCVPPVMRTMVWSVEDMMLFLRWVTEISSRTDVFLRADVSLMLFC